MERLAPSSLAAALEFYTGDEITSGDFDLVSAHADIVGEALLQEGFRFENRRGVRLGGFLARKRLLRLDDARFAAARNMGAARTASKRQLLQALADEASLQGRKAPFAGHQTA